MSSSSYSIVGSFIGDDATLIYGHEFDKNSIQISNEIIQCVKVLD